MTRFIFQHNPLCGPYTSVGVAVLGNIFVKKVINSIYDVIILTFQPTLVDRYYLELYIYVRACVRACVQARVCMCVCKYVKDCALQLQREKTEREKEREFLISLCCFKISLQKFFKAICCYPANVPTVSSKFSSLACHETKILQDWWMKKRKKKHWDNTLTPTHFGKILNSILLFHPSKRNFFWYDNFNLILWLANMLRLKSEIVTVL